MLATHSPYASGLDQTAANHIALTPTTFLDRAASVWPDRIAVVHGDLRRTWAETAVRCRLLASALARRAGLGVRALSAMAVTNPAWQGLVIGFSGFAPDVLHAAAQRFAAALNRF